MANDSATLLPLDKHSSSINTKDINDLYRQHQPWLKGWLRNRLGCPHDAEDLAQDTFVRVIRSGQPSSSLHDPHRYLITVARGLTIDLFRRRTLEHQYLQALAAKPQQEWPSEEAQAIILETLVELDIMFDGMGKNVKKVFILSRLEGLKYADIAGNLGISLRTVKYHMAEAMEHCCLYRLHNAL